MRYSVLNTYDTGYKCSCCREDGTHQWNPSASRCENLHHWPWPSHSLLNGRIEESITTSFTSSLPAWLIIGAERNHKRNLLFLHSQKDSKRVWRSRGRGGVKNKACAITIARQNSQFCIAASYALRWEEGISCDFSSMMLHYWMVYWWCTCTSSCIIINFNLLTWCM